MSTPLNPNNTICVLKHDGREVGRVAATAKHAQEYIKTMTEFYDKIEIEYVEDSMAASISRMLAPR